MLLMVVSLKYFLRKVSSIKSFQFLLPKWDIYIGISGKSSSGHCLAQLCFDLCRVPPESEASFVHTSDVCVRISSWITQRTWTRLIWGCPCPWTRVRDLVTSCGTSAKCLTLLLWGSLQCGHTWNNSVFPKVGTVFCPHWDASETWLVILHSCGNKEIKLKIVKLVKRFIKP